MKSENQAWLKRIASMIEADVRSAEQILSEHGFTAEQAFGFVKQESTSGVWRQFVPSAPKEFQDPTHQCYYALRILLLAQRIREAEPQSVQFGRLWGRAAVGLEFPDVAKSMRSWLLDQHRGIGGAKPNDLTLSLRQIIQDNADADSAFVLHFLRSEEAADSFHNIEQPSIHITNVEIDTQRGEVIYEDRSRKTHKIKITSLDRKIRELRKKVAL